jgi:uncharacterized glyoxalase superfamily protein PhnB
MATKFISIAPTFLVADVKWAAEYYRDQLGFEVRAFFGDPPVFGLVARDGVSIHLSLMEGGRGGSNRKWKPIAFDAYIQVQDVDALHGELQARRANLVGPPQLRVYGMKELEVRDRDGYLICFAQTIPRPASG